MAGGWWIPYNGGMKKRGRDVPNDGLQKRVLQRRGRRLGTVCLVVLVLVWAVSGRNLAATEVLTSTPDPVLVEFLEAIAADDVPACTSLLAGHPELVNFYFRSNKEMLRAAGLDVLLDQIGRPPELNCVPALHIAAALRQVKVAELLIAHGADIGARNQTGDDPLVFALYIYSGGDLLAMVKLLLDHGADANSYNGRGWGPLHALAMNSTGQADGPIVAALIAAGADVNHRDLGGRTPIMYVAQQDYSEPKAMVRSLVDHGADLSIRDNDGWTVQDHAFASDDREGIQIALYPYYGKLPGILQLLLFLAVVVAMIRWIRRRNRALQPLTEETWVAQMSWPATWANEVDAATLAAVPQQLQRKQTYQRWLNWSLVPFVAGWVVTLLVFQDSMLLRVPTTKALFVYAAGYCLGYVTLFLRIRAITAVVLILGVLYTALGVFFLGFQGWGFCILVEEYSIGGMHFLCALLFLWQTGLLAAMTVQGVRMELYEDSIRKRFMAALKAEEIGRAHV